MLYSELLKKRQNKEEKFSEFLLKYVNFEFI